MPTGERLGPMDATLLYLESPTSTSNIGLVFRFDGPIDFDAFVRDFESNRLPRLPRFRQVIAPVPFNLGFPTWETDPRFDLSQHFDHLELESPGDDGKLSETINRIMARRVNLQRPPWEITLINGLDDGGAALILHMHHCITDGAGVPKVFDALFDDAPRPFQSADAAGSDSEGGALPGAWTRIAGVFRDRKVRRERAQRRAAADPESPSEKAARKATEKQQLKDFGQVMKEFMQAPAVRLPFNAPLSGGTHYGRLPLDFGDVRQVAEAWGGTINDVLLAVLGGAVNRYANEQGIETKDKFLRVYQAANTRRSDEHEDWGNRLAFMPALVPLGIDDAVARFAETAAYTKKTKALGVRDAADRMVRLFQSVLPPPLAKLGLRLMLARVLQKLGALSKRPPGFNIYLTNVRFPAFEYYLGERRMTEMSALAPLVPNTGVTCTAMNFDGRLCLSVSADRETLPDVERFCRMLQDAFDECVRAATTASIEDGRPPH